MTETHQMLTPRDVAGILGVHQKTVHLWLRTGKIKGVKISYRAWRIPQSALDHFIEQRSNVIPQKGAEEQKKAEFANLPVNAIPGSPAADHDTPQAKMKHYIQDIMGEKLPEKDLNK